MSKLPPFLAEHIAEYRRCRDHIRRLEAAISSSHYSPTCPGSRVWLLRHQDQKLMRLRSSLRCMIFDLRAARAMRVPYPRQKVVF